MSHSTLLQPEDRVLPTLEADGSRRWLYPRLAKGKVWNARRWVAHFGIAAFTLVPFIRINGQPMVLADLAGRKLHLLGQTFLPRDTVYLALLLVSFVLTIFLTTAVLGRAWCGWTCPQTVYLEFVFRPVERLFLGRRGVRGKPKAGLAATRYLGMYAAFLVISLYLAHTFLSYFVGVEQLRVWITQSPIAHPWSFGIIAVATAGMMYNFSVFREQMCLIACPYGRFQSVLLDRNSLIVKYDAARGEPRRAKKVASSELRVAGRAGLALPILPTPNSQLPTSSGDCVACGMCVQVCPTGIDIRDGLQFECVNCAQCIDACDAVMAKVKRPLGLIGYRSQNMAEGLRQRFVRPRVVVYATAIALLLSTLVTLVATRFNADVLVVRNQGLPFVMAPDGRAESTLRVQITNRLDVEQSFDVSVVGDPRVELVEAGRPVVLAAGANVQYPVHVMAEPSLFFGTGMRTVTVRVREADGRNIDRQVQIFGPGAAPETSGDASAENRVGVRAGSATSAPATRPEMKKETP
jgi:cytochrome c oxidase accessory protein FixG